jgi:hypothetical protein
MGNGAGCGMPDLTAIHVGRAGAAAMLRRFALVVVLGVVQGCSMLASHPRALQPMQGFVALDEDKRVLIEKEAVGQGARDYGRKVSALLDEAIDTVEKAHYLVFAETPVVYVCATEACFKRHVSTPGLSAAVIPDNRLVLSPNLNGKESSRLKPLLIHELAHLHLGQRVGHYHYNIPVWFHEGWASLTANGGGAEFATDAEAIDAARQGKMIDLAQRDTPDVRHKAKSYGLNIHVFYRQSMLLVQALKQRDDERFRQLALALQSGGDFEIAFWNLYGAGPQGPLADAFILQSGDNGAAAPSAPE